MVTQPGLRFLSWVVGGSSSAGSAVNSARSWRACSKPSRGSARWPASTPIRPADGCTKTTFHRIPPDQHDRIVDIITRFDPHVLVHVGVWEPDARASPNVARHLTDQAATSIIGAAAECPALENVIVRSGIEIYGRGRGALTRPDETAPVMPTCEWGRTRRRDRAHRVTGGEPGRREHRHGATRTRARPARAVAARAPVAHAGRAVLRARRPAVRRDRGSRRRPRHRGRRPCRPVATGATSWPAARSPVCRRSAADDGCRCP